VTARNPDQLKELVSGKEKDALAVQLDVTNRAQIAHAVQQAEKKFGQINVLVNNAGYGYIAAIEEGEEDQVRAMFETNFFGLVDLTKAVLPGMRKRRSGWSALPPPATIMPPSTRWKVCRSRFRSKLPPWASRY
jgi:NADP-dependent 3-hydroxy acid dehydrogenase YdfG